MRLDGKVALITGAATGVQGELMGFGGTTARLFVREGAKVVLGDINEELGEKTAAQIREGGGHAIFVRLDVTAEQDWINAVQVTVSHFGRLDVLVNNAGTVAGGLVEETPAGVWEAQMDVHAKGAFLGTKHAIPEMRKAGGGSIINVSSIAGLVGTLATAYCAGKGANRLLAKATAIQYAKDKIRVNSVHPGYVETPMTYAHFQEAEARDWRLARTPMGRFGTAQEIANGILYLASDESSYVTGSELVIDGGLTAQ